MTALGATGIQEMPTSQMPRGVMPGSATAAMTGIVLSNMPLGRMTHAEEIAAACAGAFPCMEITGEWTLTLSRISLKSGGQS
jgi:hypothetical protein